VEKISSFNFKGGVGKTTIAVQLAHGLAKADYKVLLLDLDSQNNCSLFLGISEDDWNKTFFDLIDYHKDIKVDECIIEARENLHLLPSSEYNFIERDFHREPNLNIILEDALDGVESMNYDYLIIDCSPAKSIVNDAILYYTDHLVVTVKPEAGSIAGIKQIYKRLNRLKISTEKIKMVVPNQVRKTTKEHKENLEKLKETFQEENIITEPIYLRTKIAEATKEGKTIYEHDKKAQKQFHSILKEVVSL